LYREKFAKEFCASLESYRFNKDNLSTDIWVFLECILDESFKELDTHIAFPGTEPNPEVIPTIARRSSQLEKLEIKFSNMKKETNVEKVEQVFLSLNNLKNLTSLHIDHLNDCHTSVLKFIGRACPLLTTLKVHFELKHRRLRMRHILAIVVGELVDKLIPPSDGNQSEESEDESMYEDEEQNPDEPIWMAAKSFQRIWVPHPVPDANLLHSSSLGPDEERMLERVWSAQIRCYGCFRSSSSSSVKKTRWDANKPSY